MESKCRDNWLKVQCMAASVLLFKDTIALSQDPCEVEVRQHQKTLSFGSSSSRSCKAPCISLVLH